MRTAAAGVRQHTLIQSLALHLLPGALITVFYVVAAPLAIHLHAPALLAFYLAIAVVLIPVELGYLLYVGRKQTGTLSLASVVSYREPMPLWHYVGLVISLGGWFAICIAVASPPVDNFLTARLFAWLPDWFFATNLVTQLDQYSRTSLMLVAVLGVVLNGLAGPIVEELYFRGYLLPRLAWLGRWAPLANTVLFSLYHFWTPWQNPGRIIGLLPLYYAVAWKRNIYLGMIVHCLGNTLGSLGLAALILRST